MLPLVLSGCAAVSSANVKSAILAAVPLPLSSVQLTGDWAEAQREDQDVLISLNLTEWACHFTSTANITSCATPSNPAWHTYIKNSSFPAGFSPPLEGFLASGDDMRPALLVPFGQCLNICRDSAACAGFTFHHEESTSASAPLVRCFTKTAVHFSPESGKSNCVAAGGVGQPACSPLPGEMGLGGYYGHYQGHWLSVSTPHVFTVSCLEALSLLCRRRSGNALSVLLASDRFLGEQHEERDRGEARLGAYDPLLPVSCKRNTREKDFQLLRFLTSQIHAVPEEALDALGGIAVAGARAGTRPWYESAANFHAASRASSLDGRLERFVNRAFFVNLAQAVQLLSRVMDAWRAKYGVDGYLFPYDPLVFDKLLAGHGA
eukprot:1924436-Pleurochrysis_carterae.AAC.4